MDDFSSVLLILSVRCCIALLILDHPPLKRRLLEDFDRTDDGSRGSPLIPEKCSPNGRLLKQPNILHFFFVEVIDDSLFS